MSSVRNEIEKANPPSESTLKIPIFSKEPKEEIQLSNPNYNERFFELDSEIIQSEKKFFEHFLDCKRLYLEFKNKILDLRSSMGKGEGQVKAMDVLIRHGIQNYENIRELKGNVKVQLNQDERNYDEHLKKFNAALILVKKIFLLKNS